MTYSAGSYRFDLEKFFPLSLFERIVELRLYQPELAEQAAAARRRRAKLAPDGRLALLAADHPARGVISVVGNPTALGDRYQYLGRILRALPALDGIMATSDVLDELLLLDGWRRERGAAGFLDDKVLLGSGNRGGLAGASHELDDRLTATTPERASALGFDGMKYMIRIEDDDPDAIVTLEYVSQAINRCAELGIPVFLESLPMRRENGKLRLDRRAEAVIRAVNIASGLGGSSLNRWLKLPYVDGYESVARSTTLPILILGGESANDPTPFLDQLRRGLCAGPTVRGALAGRNVLFPGDDDPYAVAVAVQAVVHEGLTAEEAVTRLEGERDKGFSRLREEGTP
ncbi:MAG: deoxyribose-phosphate aldolase [Chloroflexi bacterium]|nr:deoxyribose-phosphate aldolase [Chloroflexota bacterium]